LRRSSRKILVAVVAGVLLAGAPTLIFNLWLDQLIDRDGQHDVEISAKRAIVLAEARISQVLATLAQLAEHRVEICSAEHVALMRDAAFRTAPIKEIAVLGLDGQPRCVDLAYPLGSHQMLGPRRIGRPGENLIEVVRPADRGERLLRVRRVEAAGHGLAALIPAELFLPQSASNGERFTAFVRLTTSDGTLIVQSGTDPSERLPASDLYAAQVESTRHEVTATVAMPKADLVPLAHLNRIRMVVNCVVAVLLFGFAYVVPRWREEDPIADIEQALKARELVPYYHPVVDIKSGRIIGAEVLVRWRKPDGTVVSPGAFVPMIEQRGLIMEMTSALMRQVCTEAGAALGSRPRLKISFNLAARHFADDRIVAEVSSIFADSPIRMSQVVLEVTERQPLDNLTSTRRVIAALQGLGCKVALDDVGTGHNGLSHILKLGVDIIKIDKMFVDAIGTERNSATIIESLVDLARNMRMEIIAEGVENFDQVVYLRDHGIRSAQGFVFAPPLPGSSFLTLLEAIDPPRVPAEQPAATPHYISARNRAGAV
jgi:sensor c-di-GMP phosphodiesterase-like protein